MCDQNIAVSIRTLNQMSSIIPNRMEKLRLASLSAGIVAGFTTDCNYGDEVSLMKGYNTTVVSRVESLERVLKDYIILNKSWFNTGARTISDTRNIFITGRRHPINNLANVFALIKQIEFKQNSVESAIKIDQGLNILIQYGIDLDQPFYRMINTTKEKGLLHTLCEYREHVIKTAKRITPEGNRLDILDEDKLSKVISVIAGLVIGYCEPLPSTFVDFNEYYATTAYPFGVSLTNQLVEKLVVDTDLLFSTYRATLETRYELAYEPVTTVRGLLSLLISNKVFSENMVEAINTSNKEELISYVVSMVKGVYDVRKEALERTVLHELDYLPVDMNPLGDLINKPESREDIQKRMDELTQSVEALLIENIGLDEKQLKSFRRISVETLSGRQALGIAMVIMGGALMAWAVYTTFFKNSAGVAKKTSNYHDQTLKQLQETNKRLASIRLADVSQLNNLDEQLDRMNKQLKNAKVLTPEPKFDTWAKEAASIVAKATEQTVPVEKIKLPEVKYKLVGDLGENQPDLSVEKVTSQLDTFTKYQKALANNELESLILPEKFKSIKTVEDFDRYCWKAKDTIQIAGKTYRPRPWRNTSGMEVTNAQLIKYIEINLLDKATSDKLKQCAEYAEANADRTSKIDYEARAKEYEDIIKAAISDISEKDLKSCLSQIKDLNQEIQSMYKIMGKAFIWFHKNVMAWDNLAVKHMKTINIIVDTFKEDPKTGKITI